MEEVDHQLPEEPASGARRRPALAGAILAGGRASRLHGFPKGLLHCRPGLTIVEHLVREMRAAGVPAGAVIANDPEPYRECGLPILADVRRGMGPLGGILTGLAHFAGSCDGVLFLPCDLPAITANEIDALVDAFAAEAHAPGAAARDASRWHPLCCVVRTGIIPAVNAAIDEGERSVARLWARLGVRPVEFRDAGPFFNINCPDDVEMWLNRDELGEKRKRG